jgi:homoserine dehydrogenase
VTTFGDIPGPLSAAAYDTVWYLRGRLIETGSDAGALLAGLIAGPALDLVSGTINPVTFANGDLIHRAMVYELGAGGGPTVVAVFDDAQRVTIEDAGNTAQ